MKLPFTFRFLPQLNVYLVILVGSYSHELCSGEDDGVELSVSEYLNISAGGFHNVQSWLVLVHAVDNYLQQIRTHKQDQ